MKPIAIFITYTMLNPIVGGAFFRALRLACELERRGWAPVICNHGPELSDPKIEAARNKVQFVQLIEAESGRDSAAAQRYFKSFKPAVIIMGEGPISTMKVYYEGAKRLKVPFVVLDQYYNEWLMPQRQNVDLILQYGLWSFWKGEVTLPHPYAMVPPFIEEVTPKADLPVPPHLSDDPWLLLVAYERQIVERGIELLAQLDGLDAVVITVSPDPDEAGSLLSKAYFDVEKRVTLPLQSDANIFGLMAASRVVIVSNGFLQIMEALAMGAPVIALYRGQSVGMSVLNIDPRFHPYVSFGEDLEQQKRRVLQWFNQSPFPPSLRAALKHERGGTRICADLIEDLLVNGT